MRPHSYMIHCISVAFFLFVNLQKLDAQSFRLERFQDGRSLGQGKFLFSAGLSLFNLSYSADSLRTIGIIPVPSLGSASVSGSVGLTSYLDFGIEVGGTLGKTFADKIGGSSMFATWLKTSFFPQSSPFQLALQGTVGISFADSPRTLPGDTVARSWFIRSNLLTIDVSLPFSYDFDVSWLVEGSSVTTSLLFTPHLATTSYNAGVGWYDTGANGVKGSNILEVAGGGWVYGFSIGIKQVPIKPEWYKEHNFWESGLIMFSFAWKAGNLIFPSLSYQCLFPSFGTLLTTVTQQEYEAIERDRKQKDSLLVLQNKQIELERSRNARSLSAEITSISGIAENGEPQPNPVLHIEEFSASERRPLVASVFFEDNSYIIPTRYKRLRSADRTTFKVEDVANLRLVEMYRNILNIIGKRMSDNPDAKITLTGFTTNIGDEARNPSLANRRASSVADYIIDVWRISPNRINIAPATNVTSDGNASIASYRRVDISSSNPDILCDVQLNYVERKSTPSEILFGLDIAAGLGIKQWSIELTQLNGREIRTLKQENSTKSNVSQYLWDIAENPFSMPSSEENIVARLEVTDINNRIAESSLAVIPVKYFTMERKRRSATTDVIVEIGFYWLFGKNGTSKVQTDVITSLPILDSNSTLIISTQEAIDPEQKQRLQEQLQAKSLGTAKIIQKGAIQRFPSNSPEELIYSRLFKCEYRKKVAVRQ